MFHHSFIHRNYRNGQTNSTIIGTLPKRMNNTTCKSLSSTVKFHLNRALRYNIRNLHTNRVSHKVNMATTTYNIRRLHVAFQHYGDRTSVVTRPCPAGVHRLSFPFSSHPLRVRITHPAETVYQTFSSRVPALTKPAGGRNRAVTVIPSRIVRYPPSHTAGDPAKYSHANVPPRMSITAGAHRRT